MDRVLVAFSSEESQRRIGRLLESCGLLPACGFFSGADVIRAVRKAGSALVVCGFKLRDMTASDLAASLRGCGAVLVISSASYLDLCEGENLFKLATPVSRSEFTATLELLQQFQTRQLRPPLSKRSEDEQQLIQKAKTLLMEVNRMSEAEAHRFLQKRSMDTGAKLTETAQAILDSYTF